MAKAPESINTGTLTEEQKKIKETPKSSTITPTESTVKTATISSSVETQKVPYYKEKSGTNWLNILLGIFIFLLALFIIYVIIVMFYISIREIPFFTLWPWTYSKARYDQPMSDGRPMTEPEIMFYQNPDFMDEYGGLTKGVYPYDRLMSLKIRPEMIRSAKIPKGYCAGFYTGDDLSGENLTYCNRPLTLPDNYFGNVHSIRIYPDVQASA